MKIEDVLKRLKENKITIGLKNGKLFIGGKKEDISHDSLRLLKQHKVELEAFLKARQHKVQAAPSIGKAPSDARGLSYAQQRLWFIDQYEGASALYNIPVVLELKGKLNIEALNAALSEVITRHHSLRTVFIKDGMGEAHTHLLDAESFILPLNDISKLANIERDEALQAHIQAQVNCTFDLSADLMLKGSLTKCSDSNYVLCLVMHHIASDGWSVGALVNEINLAYVAFTTSQKPVLPELTLQYADYAHWQQNYFSDGVLKSHLDYWKKQLDGIPELHGLPLDKSRPSERTYQGKTHTSHISAQQSAQLKTVCQKQGATLFMGINAIFSALLAQYSNATDVVVGTPIANREQQELAPLIGFFVNTLVLRTDLSDNPDFVTLLERSKQTTLDAYSHQQLPFDRLVEELQPARSLSHSPLFQVMLSLQNNDVGSINLPDLEVSPLNGESKIAKFDLTLNVTESEQGLSLDWEYNTSLFEANSIEKMARHFNNLVSAILANPQVSVLAICLLDEQEKAQQLVQWNATETAYAIEDCLHHAFERQALNTPDNIALVHGKERITYGELNSRANQLAHYLLQKGVTAGDVVGICLERSSATITAMLAVLKAGATYVPLDPNYPQDRLDHIVESSALNTVVTSTYARQLRAFPKQNNICIGEPEVEAALATISDKNLVAQNNDAQSLSHIIYTSGSTGKPKGVSILHSAAVAMCAWAIRHYDEADLAGVLAATSICFDLSVFEIFVPLSMGGKVIVVDNALDIASVVEPQEITLVNTVPSAIKALLENRLLPQHVRVVNLAGEELPNSTVCEIYRQLPDCRVYNLYGPSEDTTYSTFAHIPEGFYGESPIGKPIDNGTVYVLGQNRQLLPVGVAGELYVGGAGLSQGYYKRADLTQERFVEHPYSDVSGARLYRTGDLVRWQNDGTLAYLGRIDNQVKIRGFRIELSEIEHQMRTVSGVEDALVLAQEHNNKKILVAYLAGTEQQLTAAVRQHLVDSLPDYMVPDAFVELEAFPLTPNGKIDRKALPAPQIQSNEQTYLPPQNDTQQRLCDIWQQVLGLEKVGIRDNFFAIGGDSILSIQVVAQANAMGIGISTKGLFTHQTIEQLAANVEQVIVNAQQDDVAGPLTLLPIQRYFLDSQHAVNHFNQSILLKLPEMVGESDVYRLFEYLVQRHDALRLRFAHTQHGWRAEHLDGVSNILSQAFVSESKTIEQSWPTWLESRCQHWQSSLDIERGPLFKVVLLSEGRERRLFVVFHHLIVDGVSWRVILADLNKGLQLLQDNLPMSLERKTSSLQLWGQKLFAYSQSPALLKESSYWQAQLAPVPALPIDHGEPKSVLESTTRRIEIGLNKEQTDRLLHQCSQAYRTRVNELLLAGVMLGMQRWSSNQAFKVVLEGHGREELFDDVVLNQTVGWFTSHYPVRFAFQSTDVAQTIVDVKEQLRRVPNKGIGFGILEAHTHELQSSDTDLYSTLVFNYLGQLDRGASVETLLEVSDEVKGCDIGPAVQRWHQLGLNGLVKNGQLTFILDYSQQQYQDQNMEALATLIEQGLNEVIAHCSDTDAGYYTPSDFPLAQVSQSNLTKWVERYPLIEDLYAATPMQQGMHYHSQIENGAYVTQLCVTLESQLEPLHFKQAWQAATKQHKILRTAFVESDEGLQQLVVSQAPLVWQDLDWQSLSDEQQNDQIKALMREDQVNGYDFAEPSQMRFYLIRLAENKWQFFWSHHHILLDGWCLPIVFNDVLTQYQALNKGQALQFGAQPQYKDYIQWLAAQEHVLAQDYWSDQLKDIDSATPLPFSEHDVDSDLIGYAEKELSLDKQTTARLESLASAGCTTMSTVVQAAWAYLLSRYCNDEKVMFGTTVSGRPAQLAGVEQMVGLFINTVPVVATIAHEQPLLEWLKTLHQAHIQRDEHSYLPLTEIHALSNMQRDTPLFDSLYIFENYPIGKEQDTDNDFNIVDVMSNEQNNFALTLSAFPGDALAFRITYQKNKFADSSIVLLGQHLKQLLESMAQDPMRPLGDLEILSAQERNYQLHELNRTASPLEPFQSTLELFESQVLQASSAIAVKSSMGSLNYAQLDEQANQLAHYLHIQGNQAGSLIGVCLERTPNMLVALLAVWKLGCGYVPIDPSYPQERIDYVIAHSRLRTVITQSEYAPRLGGEINGVVCLDDSQVQTQLSTYDVSTSLPTNVEPHSTAYVIYTSGSTGAPKGVEITHKNLANFVLAMSERTQWNAQTRCLAITTLAFDIAVVELYLPLIQGGCIYLADEQQSRDPVALMARLEQDNINMMQATPATWQMLITAGWKGANDFNVLVGGEALTHPLDQHLLERACAVWNCYGPTEASVWTLVKRLEKTHSASERVAIGNPLNNLRHYVLDKAQRLLPLGMVGELYIGGEGVAKGYFAREDLTKERFINNPFKEHSEPTIYRTGDLVRYLPNGDFEFLGRCDDQVKIRGFRIELSEVENHLNRLDTIRHCAVVAQQDEFGAQRLVAFFVPKSGVESPDNVTLHQALKTTLPDYMVPSALVELSELPMTPNKKVDRKLLSTYSVEFVAQAYEAPTCELEITLCELWQEMLGLEQVGITEDFFTLGGHSLLATRLLFSVNDMFGCNVRLHDFLQVPTIASLSELIEQQKQEKDEDKIHSSADAASVEAVEELEF